MPRRRSALAFKIKQNEFRCTESDGVLLIDRAKGRGAFLEMRWKQEVKLTLDFGGQETQVELSQTGKTTVKTADANPLN